MGLDSRGKTPHYLVISGGDTCDRGCWAQPLALGCLRRTYMRYNLPVLRQRRFYSASVSDWVLFGAGLGAAGLDEVIDFAD